MTDFLSYKKIIFLITLICLTMFLQITEEMLGDSYIETSEYESSTLTQLESIPILGGAIDMVTLNIPDAPPVITLVLNVINAFILLAIILIVISIVYNTATLIPFIG